MKMLPMKAIRTGHIHLKGTEKIFSVYHISKNPFDQFNHIITSQFFLIRRKYSLAKL